MVRFVERRRAIARRYDRGLSEIADIDPLLVRPDVDHAYHLYVVRVNRDRRRIFEALRAEGIGVNVHYIPVPWHPLYQCAGYRKGSWPVAESAYERLLTLPLWPGMSDDDIEDVVKAVEKVLAAYAERAH